MRFFLLIFISFLVSSQALSQNWIEYYDSTEIYWEKDWAKCVDLLQRALPLAREDIGTESEDYLVLLNDLGLSFFYLGEYDSAERIIAQALALKKDLFGENDVEVAITSVNLGGIYLKTGKSYLAEEYYQQAITFFESDSLRYRKDLIYAVSDLGTLYEKMGYFPKSQAQYHRVLNYHAYSDSLVYLKTLNDLARLNRKIGDYAQSKYYLDKALEEIDSLGLDNTIPYASTLNNLGNYFVVTGDYREAEMVLKQSIEVSERQSNSDRVQVAEFYNNLANVYQLLGNTKLASEYYSRSLKYFEDQMGKQSSEYAKVLHNFGNFFENLGSYDEALSIYQEAADLELIHWGNLHPIYAGTQNNLGTLYRQLNDFEKAEEAYGRAIKIYRDYYGEEHPLYASSLANLGLLQAYQQKTNQGVSLLENAVRTQKISLGHHHPALAGTLNNLATAYLMNGQYEEAEPIFDEAIQNQLDQVKYIFPSLSESEKETFFQTFQADLERFNTFALDRMAENPQILGKMYDHQLKTKAILFRSVKRMREGILSSDDQELISRFESWLSKRDELGYYYGLNQTEITNLGINLQSLEQEVNDLEKQLSVSSEAFAEENQEVSWKEIQANLGEGEAAIELVRFRKFSVKPGELSAEASFNTIDFGFSGQVFYAALILTHQTETNPDIVVFENGIDLENRFLAYYKNALRFRVEDNYSYLIYWKKIKDKLPDLNRIYFSPDGIYNLINLSAVINPINQEYIFDEVELLPLTSTKDLLFSHTPSTSREGAFFANPNFNLKAQKKFLFKRGSSQRKYIIRTLPGTVEEVQKIDSLTSLDNWTNQIFLEEEASEENIKSLRNPRVLHIASHGFFTRDVIERYEHSESHSHNVYLRSGLMLAGAEGSIHDTESSVEVYSQREDGILTAYEVMNLRLEETDLVVLSACESGLGDIRTGEGVYGLQRAFRVAGAKSLIISLWKVDDQATKELMVQFYDQWLKTGDKVKALRLAQDHIRQIYQDPYYWGCFCYGRKLVSALIHPGDVDKEGQSQDYYQYSLISEVYKPPPGRFSNRWPALYL